MRTNIKRFLDYILSQGYSPRTVKQYSYHLETYIKWAAGQGVESIIHITHENLQAYQHYLYHEYQGARKASISLGYQLNLLEAVKHFCAYLFKAGLLLHDPAKALELPKPPKSLPRNIMSKREVKKLLSLPDLKNPSGYRDRVALELLYSTGMRKEELRELQINHINLTHREILIEEGKGCKDRMVPITKKTAHYVEMYIKQHRPTFIYAAESPYLLLTNRGKKMGKNSILDMVKRYCKEGKISSKVCTHSFRHTCATHLLQGNASIRAIQELLGHKHLNSTEIYTHVHIKDLKRLVDRHHPRDRFGL